MKISFNAYEERNLAYAAMDIKLEGSEAIMAESHAAEAKLDGDAIHVFEFRLPEANGVRNMSWRARWNSIEKTGSGTPGSTQKAVFQATNKDCWSFASPVVIRVGDAVPQPVLAMVMPSTPFTTRAPGKPVYIGLLWPLAAVMK